MVFIEWSRRAEMALRDPRLMNVKTVQLDALRRTLVEKTPQGARRVVEELIDCHERGACFVEDLNYKDATMEVVIQ